MLLNVFNDCTPPLPPHLSLMIITPSVGEFRSYLEYCRGLGYKDAPDYAHLKVRLCLEASDLFSDLSRWPLFEN